MFVNVGSDKGEVAVFAAGYQNCDVIFHGGLVTTVNEFQVALEFEPGYVGWVIFEGLFQ